MEATIRTKIEDKNEFNRYGYHHTKIYADDARHIYVFQMEKIEKDEFDNPDIARYEVVKGKKAKQPDGSTVYIYPGDEDFGTYGWYICYRKDIAMKRVNHYVKLLEERFNADELC